MRIAHVYKDYVPPLHGGIMRYVADIAAATAARGHDVEVHVAGAASRRTDRMPDGVTVHRHREVGRLLSSPLSLSLPLTARRLDADILHVHMPNPIGELGAFVNRRRTALVASFHAQVGRQRFLEPIYGPFRKRFFDRCDAVVVSSAMMAAAPELAGHQDSVHILPYGVSPSLASYPPATRSHDDRALRLLFVGRLVYYKGVDVLLEALARIRDCDVRLTVVGSGPLREELQQRSARLGIEHRVCFTGSVDDDALHEYYRSADVFVMPSVSRAEAFGLAMCEAMAHGMPAISTTVGTGTDWVNVDGVTGLVVPPGEPAALADAVRTLAGDGALRERLGQGARERARTEFSFERHLDALVDLYELLR